MLSPTPLLLTAVASSPLVDVLSSSFGLVYHPHPLSAMPIFTPRRWKCFSCLFFSFFWDSSFTDITFIMDITIFFSIDGICTHLMSTLLQAKETLWVLKSILYILKRLTSSKFALLYAKEAQENGKYFVSIGIHLSSRCFVLGYVFIEVLFFSNSPWHDIPSSTLYSSNFLLVSEFIFSILVVTIFIYFYLS